MTVGMTVGKTGTPQHLYDPDARRDTPLARSLIRRITRDGPISVAEYMGACLFDERDGYYQTKSPLGRDGDFITAPEISQVFGEILGLWAVVAWQQMGAPEKFNLIELGPGRGTLMHDALRAAQLIPKFGKAATVHLIECSPILAQTQRELLAQDPIPKLWHQALIKTIENPKGQFATELTVPPLPTILIANEFIDAVPVQQFENLDGHWHERTVALDDENRLVFQTSPHKARGIGDLTATLKSPEPKTVIERLGGIGDLTSAFGQISAQAPLAALFIDYGHTKTAAGDTLQAVRNHKTEHPLTSPGEADLTAHVDFAQLARRFTDTGLTCDTPLTQAEFLGRLGIVERASKLMANNPARAAEIELAVARIMAPTGMGGRFQVLGVRSNNVEPFPGF